MKNVILIFAMIFTTYVVNAEQYPIIQVDKEKIFVLDLNDWAMDQLHITIREQQGKEIFSDYYDGKGNPIIKYDVRSFPNGMYSVKVSDEYKSVSFDLFVSYQTVTLVGEEKVIFKPFVKFSNNMLDINLMSLNNDVSLLLYDPKGKLIYEDSVYNLPVYAKRLNLENMGKGTYTVSIEVDGESFTDRITK